MSYKLTKNDERVLNKEKVIEETIKKLEKKNQHITQLMHNH